MRSPGRSSRPLGSARRRPVSRSAVGRLWVGDSSNASVLELEPEAGTVVRTIAAPALTPPPLRPGRTGGGAIAFGFGAAWFSSGNATITRVDPETGSVSARIRHDGLTSDDASQLAAGEGGVWVSSCCSVVTRIDPRTNAPAPALHGFDGPIATGLGGVWLAAAEQGTLWRIEPSDRETRKRLHQHDRAQSDQRRCRPRLGVGRQRRRYRVPGRPRLVRFHHDPRSARTSPESRSERERSG